ncbi:MAG: PfkB family carbohydrate kinase [Streptococcus sp.]
MHPILHVNETEALAFSGCREIQPVIERLYQRTGQLVIVTLGRAVAYDCNWYEADGFQTEVVDTVGAGDSHVSLYIHC